MAEDLAIDVGIPKDSEEFETFVTTVTNILDSGCGYNTEATEHIIEKCNKSELDIAKRVITLCRRQYRRKTHQKWWETWKPSAKQTNSSTRPNRRQKRTTLPPKRPMSPMFNSRHRKRPMSPMFNSRRLSPQRRKVFPQYGRNDGRNDGYESERASHYQTQRDRGRDSDVPEWPSKRRRVR